MEDYSLLYFLSQVPETRKKKGHRHPLHAVIGMLIMSIQSGSTSFKSFSRFVTRHSATLVPLFDLKHGTPCYATLRTIVKGIDFEELNKAMFLWCNHHAPLESADWFSADGKALRSTVTDGQTINQTFITLVSIYSHSSGLVYSATKQDSKKSYEPEVVRQMLIDLEKAHSIDLKTLKMRLDAVHCEKKP
jgi:hypothetical protein